MVKGPARAEPSNGSGQLSHLNQRTIFRTEALRHYRQSQDRIEFPRFATPRAIAILWVLAIALILLGAAFGYRFVLPLG